MYFLVSLEVSSPQVLTESELSSAKHNINTIFKNYFNLSNDFII